MRALLLINFLLLHSVFAYKILVFSPLISRSHMISNAKIADELANGGHDVTLLEPDFLSIFNVTKIEVKYAKRLPVFGFSKHLWNPINKWSTKAFTKLSLSEDIQLWKDFYHAFNLNCEELLQHTQLIERLKEERFDAYFGEQLNACGSGLSHAIGIKRHFWISSCPVMDFMIDVVGAPPALSYSPSVNYDMGTKMTFFDRLWNMINYHSHVWIMEKSADELTEMFRKEFGSDFPHVHSIVRESDVIFISTDEFLEMARPEMPNWVHIGGLGKKAGGVAPLDERFSLEMAKGAKGVVFFSLGTNVNTTSLPTEFMGNILKTAKSFPDYHFLAKVDKFDKISKSTAEEIPNLSVVDWAPQPAILNHPRLSVFITHGGYNSLVETAQSGKPIITIPFFADQYKNAHMAAENGWGRTIRRLSLLQNSEELVAALKEILSNESFSTAAQHTARLLKSTPFTAEEKLLKYTKFAIENDGLAELRVHGRHLNFVVFHNYDVICVILFAIVLSLYSLWRLLRRINLRIVEMKQKAD